MRQANLAAVLDRLRRGGPVSRSGLVAATGLTRSAIGGLVKELVELGLVEEETALPDGSPGRPSPVVRVDPDSLGALAVEIGVDELGVALVGLDGAVVRNRRVARARDCVLLDEVLADIVEQVDAMGCRKVVVDGRRVVGVGVGVPGLVRRADHVVSVAPNLQWRDVDFAALLASSLGIAVPVAVGNDADLGAQAEATFGAGVGAAHVVYVSGEVGVGGSVVVNGERQGGRSGFAGEFGHLPVDPAGVRCGCGSIGCWETVVGERALLDRAGLDVDGGTTAVGELLERAAAGESRALEALAEEGRWLGVGIAGLINAFDPDVVVLGTLFNRILPSVRPSLDAEIARRRIHGLDRSVPVVGAAFGRDAALLGAAELAFAPLLADPAFVAGS
ncbi:MAG TPA: ROK family transcriptional regulator [Ilumatobacteraceae bacterium]|nr:ROK family transcriptional regulator [Ilumatobacteraceae bacterium]